MTESNFAVVVSKDATRVNPGRPGLDDLDLIQVDLDVNKSRSSGSAEVKGSVAGSPTGEPIFRIPKLKTQGVCVCVLLEQAPLSGDHIFIIPILKICHVCACNSSANGGTHVQNTYLESTCVCLL